MRYSDIWFGPSVFLLFHYFVLLGQNKWLGYVNIPTILDLNRWGQNTFNHVTVHATSHITCWSSCHEARGHDVITYQLSSLCLKGLCWHWPGDNSHCVGCVELAQSPRVSCSWVSGWPPATAAQRLASVTALPPPLSVSRLVTRTRGRLRHGDSQAGAHGESSWPSSCLRLSLELLLTSTSMLILLILESLCPVVLKC